MCICFDLICLLCFFFFLVVLSGLFSKPSNIQATTFTCVCEICAILPRGVCVKKLLSICVLEGEDLPAGDGLCLFKPEGAHDFALQLSFFW